MFPAEREPSDDVMRWSALECAKARWCWAQFGHKILRHYSMTWSARCRSDGGIVRPIALAGLQVDHQLEPRGLLDGEIGGFGAFENAIDVDRGAADLLAKVRSAGHEARDRNVLFSSKTVGRRFVAAS
jgi:hypothetical protein